MHITNSPRQQDCDNRQHVPFSDIHFQNGRKHRLWVYPTGAGNKQNISTGVKTGGYAPEVLQAERDIPINTEYYEEAIRLECLMNPCPGGGGVFCSLQFFFRRWGKTAVGSAVVWHAHSHILFAHFLKTSTPGRITSGHQVMSSGPISKEHLWLLCA